jgi:hypothetical protein
MERLAHKTASIALLLFILTVATRVPFASKLLYHMDSVHFALALERFDVTVHQPHPPGYFLYVMLGRLIHLCIADANLVFVSLSIVFSALAVSVVFLLAQQMYDRKTGLVAAGLAVTSPNLWFHAEIALSYGAEACFSALAGLFCWRVYTGKSGEIWLLAVLLGVAGGVRQNTVVFLMPLLFFAARKLPPGKIATALLLLGAVCAAWFFPMVRMAGGWDTYSGAFRELWTCNTGRDSVYDCGWKAISLYSKTLFCFTAYSAGAGLCALVFAAWARLRRRPARRVDLAKLSFLAVWAAPSLLFYLLVFIHPGNPGYALIYTPPLLILCARATLRLCSELSALRGKDSTVPLVSLLLLANTAIFLLAPVPVSWRTVRDHDRDLAAVLAGLRSFDPAGTAFFVLPYLFIGFRQVMYYLPQYTVYQVNLATPPPGETGSIFWGTGRNTILSRVAELPGQIRYFATVVDRKESQLVSGHRGISCRAIEPQILVAAGPISLVRQVYPVLVSSFAKGQL